MVASTPTYEGKKLQNVFDSTWTLAATDLLPRRQVVGSRRSLKSVKARIAPLLHEVGHSEREPPRDDRQLAETLKVLQRGKECLYSEMSLCPENFCSPWCPRSDEEWGAEISPLFPFGNVQCFSSKSRMPSDTFMDRRWHSIFTQS